MLLFWSRTNFGCLVKSLNDFGKKAMACYIFEESFVLQEPGLSHQPLKNIPNLILKDFLTSKIRTSDWLSRKDWCVNINPFPNNKF